MSEPSDQQSPEILIHIQAAEQSVDGMVQAAQQEATALLARARAQVETLLLETRRSLERKKAEAEAKSIAEAAREAEQLLTEIRAKAGNLKARCMGSMDEAVELVLERILPSSKGAADDSLQDGPEGRLQADE